MFKPLTFEQYQKEIDDGWIEHWNDKIVHWRKLSLRSRTVEAQKFCDKQIEYFKKLRDRRN